MVVSPLMVIAQLGRFFVETAFTLSKDDEDGCGMLWPSTIFGPTCDGMDVVMIECKLPELQLNDLIVFYNMGAYSASTGATFNGFDIQSIGDNYK
ncbi:hypothetical protein ACSBR2_022290 [Camellia fascicularis]